MDININYYDVLGIPSTASESDIKTAYRTMAKRYHPDINKDKHAEEKFKLVNEANDVLSNINSKIKYDAIRNAASASPHQGFSYNRPQNYNLVKNKDITITYNYTLEELFNDKPVVINFRPKRTNGDPETIEIVNVYIPKNAVSGYKTSIPGKGDNANPNIPLGNLFITFIQSPHKLYKKVQGGDLYADVSVDLFDFVWGTEKTLTMVDGNDIKLKIKKGSAPGSILKIPNRGLFKSPSTRGDVYITLNAVVPDLTETQQEEIKKILNK